MGCFVQGLWLYFLKQFLQTLTHGFLFSCGPNCNAHLSFIFPGLTVLYPLVQRYLSRKCQVRRGGGCQLALLWEAWGHRSGGSDLQPTQEYPAPHGYFLQYPTQFRPSSGTFSQAPCGVHTQLLDQFVQETEVKCLFVSLIPLSNGFFRTDQTVVQ